MDDGPTVDDHFGTAYEADFYAWTQEQAAALRAEAARHSNAPLDWENLAEEIEGMGGSERREVTSRMRVLLVHLLKWLHCPELRESCERGWRITIREQREQLHDALNASPSLRPFTLDSFAETYARARRGAADEAEVSVRTFPSVPPFTLEQALDPRYPIELFPEGDDD